MPGEHPAVPVTPAELARAAAGAVEAGAEALHLHPRAADGRESLDVADIGAAVTAVRAACPATPVGVSTGLWIAGGDPGRRRELVGWWAELPAPARPDFASVNVGEEGFAELAETLRRAGIAVEAGVWSVREAERLGAIAVERVLVEIIDTPADAAAERADEILARLAKAGRTGQILLHGEEEACWPVLDHAFRLGLPSRIGLEDTLVDPDGRPATDNADLITHALAIWYDAQAG
jgi:uncharacterized protein (DUF849 family)